MNQNIGDAQGSCASPFLLQTLVEDQELVVSNNSEIAVSRKRMNLGSFPGDATQCPNVE